MVIKLKFQPSLCKVRIGVALLFTRIIIIRPIYQQLYCIDDKTHNHQDLSYFAFNLQLALFHKGYCIAWTRSHRQDKNINN